MRIRVQSIPAGALALLVLLCWPPSQVLAQTTDQAPEAGAAPVSARYKGSVGLGLIGAELGAVIPALAGARGWWAFVAFPVLGAAGGALAGHYWLERDDIDSEFAVAALVTGMALVIPAAVVTVAATSYEHHTEVQLAAAARARNAAVAAGSGLFRVSEGSVIMAPPRVSVGASISAREALRTGVARARVVRMALLSGAF